MCDVVLEYGNEINIKIIFITKEIKLKILWRYNAQAHLGDAF